MTRTDKTLSPWPGSKLSPRSAFVHPGTDRPVSIIWASPFSGKITIKGRVADAHPGGPDGIGWTLDRIEANAGDCLKSWHETHAEFAGITAGSRHYGPRSQARDSPTPSPNFRRSMPRSICAATRPSPARSCRAAGSNYSAANSSRRILGSGRKELAGWLTDAKNPLLARVIVNRVWMHHFGRGLVATPNEFGTRGEKPSHPELLDRLAADFVRDGYSLKKLHRRIVLSATYRQSAASSARRPRRSIRTISC